MDSNDRLKLAREGRGYSSAASAARAFGWTASTYASHENGNRGIQPDAAKVYGRAFRVPAGWLLYGEGKDIIDLLKITSTVNGNVKPIATRDVPLISFATAGNFKTISDPYELGGGIQTVTIDIDQDTGSRVFALVLEGESMISRPPLGDVSFYPGDTIVIDPDAAIKPGDYVVAKADREDAATFKKYRPRGTDEDGVEIIELVPLNQDYPTLRLDAQNPGHIVGKMIRHFRKF